MSDSKSSGSVGFLSLLTLLFIGLKLGKVIDWSWFWVLSPTIIPLILLFIVGGILWFMAQRKRKRHNY